MPLHSDVLNKIKDFRFLHLATLHIENTSSRNSFFYNEVDNYTTKGDCMSAYLERPIYLKILQLIEYLFKKEGSSGAGGVKFSIIKGRLKSIVSIFQGITVESLCLQHTVFTNEEIPIFKK